jgi:hypothetical protein
MDMDMRELSDLECLARYWVERYAKAIQDNPEDEQPPVIGVVGAQADAIGTADMFGDTEIENLAFLAGYLGFPCDAAYIAAAWEGTGIELVGDLDDIGVHDMRRSVMAWVHCIPTRETKVLVLLGHVTDNGRMAWLPVDVSESSGHRMFTGIEYAAHDFEKFPPQDGDMRYRKLARDLVQRDNGTGYKAQLLDSGALVARARNWTGV